MPTSSSTDHDVSSTDLRMQAINVTIHSRSSVIDGGSTFINLLAEGGGPLGDKGYVAIQGTREITVGTGPAHLSMHTDLTESNICLLNGRPGNITLVQADKPGQPFLTLDGALLPKVELGLGLPVSPTKLTMDSDSAKLAVGPPGVGASLDLSLQGVTLKYAAWSLKMGPEGVEISVGPNSVSIKPTGVSLNGLTLDLAATTRLFMQGIQIDQQASVQLSGQSSTIKVF